MQKLRTACLIISITACLISCTPETVKKLIPAASDRNEYKMPYFSDAEKDYVYKARVSAFGKDFGGIFIVKKTNDSTHRLVLTTEFGNKLLDFELSDDHFKVNFVLDELDRKIIINTLRRDFTLLLSSDFKIKKQYKSEASLIFESKEKQKHIYVFEDIKTGFPVKLVQASRAKEKIVIYYSPTKKTLAEKIIIEHQNINLKVELFLLQ